MTEVGPSENLEVVFRWRRQRFRHDASLQLHSLEQARRFVDDVGFCLLFPAPGMVIPTLWEAICGEPRPIPRRHHDDPELSHTWRWKDELPSRGWVFYGKLLRKKPTLISLKLLPYFYALSENYDDLHDYLIEYQDGKLSEEAKRVYEALLEHGALPTSVLRRRARLAGKPSASRFDRAVLELQLGLKITKVGISDANRWKYCYVYDLLARRWPDLPRQASAISSAEAMRRLLLTYLHNVGASRAEDIAWLFGWDAARVDKLCQSLAGEGELVLEAQIEGWPGQFVSLPALAKAEH